VRVNALYDAEEGRIGTYPERERQHSDNEKYRLPRQDAKGKANVLQNHIRYTLQYRVCFEEKILTNTIGLRAVATGVTGLLDSTRGLRLLCSFFARQVRLHRLG
jgi:hypothetical protein